MGSRVGSIAILMVIGGIVASAGGQNGQNQNDPNGESDTKLEFAEHCRGTSAP